MKEKLKESFRDSKKGIYKKLRDLIRLLHFIHGNVDRLEPHAVLLAQADLKGAFQRVSHQNVIMDLHDMSVPGYLLRIIASYLNGRNMTLKFRGVESSRFFLPSSSPQGVFLGVFLFIVIFNGAFLRPRVPRNIDRCRSCIRFDYFSCNHVISNVFTAKYVDDSSRARVINLLEDLEVNLEKVFPLNFHQRTGHILKREKNLLKMI